MIRHRPVTRRLFLETGAVAAGLSAIPAVGPWSQRLTDWLSSLVSRQRPSIPYVDGLSFLPGSIDAIPASGLSAFILDVSAGEMIEDGDGRPRYYRSFEACARSITQLRRQFRSAVGPAFLATRGRDVPALDSGRTAIFFQFQGCEPLGTDLDRLDMFYELGLRVLQITHHFDNPFGGGALEANPTGLTVLGHEAVERMNTLGVIPDVSHASDRCALDVTRASHHPVILSHGAARALVPNARCASDAVIRSVAESGGVMGIFMLSFWLTTDPVPTPDHLVRHLRHVINVGGADAVGIANDYPVTGQSQLAALGNDNAIGVKDYYPWWESIRERGVFGFDELPRHVVIPTLNDVRRMFTIHETLERARFRPDEIEKVMGGNWLRVLRESLG